MCCALWLGAPVAAFGQTRLPPLAAAAEAMTRANTYWTNHNGLGDSGWARGTYYTGNQRAARVLVSRAYINQAFAWAEANQWQIGPEGSQSADALNCGQTYIDLYRLDPQTANLTDITSTLNDWTASGDTHQLYWIDAFYMAGPTFARMSNLTGNTNYNQQLWQMYSYMKNGLRLYDAASSLWYRDASYIYPAATNSLGGKVFWSRGNGWVFAGLARVMQQMPASAPHYNDYATMFQTMAAKLQSLQGSDGMWRSSLLDASQYPNPETSGTGFFTYGLAWGIRTRLLSAGLYTNTVALAWHGLTNLSLQPSGLVGYVQPSANAPGPATATSTFDFGVGAFLLACSEIALLAADAPVLSPWAGPDQTLADLDGDGQETLTLNGSQTELYSGTALSYTWWEGASQLAAGIFTQTSLPTGQHNITLKVQGSDGRTYADTMSVNVTPPPGGVVLPKLRFAFEDSGTSTTDSLSGVRLNLVNANGAPTDLHGALGTGVGGAGRALDLTAAASQGGAGPLAVTTNNSTFAFGVISNFTVSLWLKPVSSLLVNGYPRFFSLGTNGTTDRGTANSLQLLSNGNGDSSTAVQGFVNTSSATLGPFNIPANQWTFLALTYDGTALRFYGGSETAAVTLADSAALAAGTIRLGTAWNLFLGNRLTHDRAFDGWIDDARFYLGAAPLAYLESIRQSPLLPPVVQTSVAGTNLVLELQTRLGLTYTLQSATNLTPPPSWLLVLNNTGTGGSLTNLIPLTRTPPRQFYRYWVH
jgi:unsaturated rhamnogalacturonyl hydrolase